MRGCQKFDSLVVLLVDPFYRHSCFLPSTFLFSSIDILILHNRRSRDAFYFTYSTSLSLEFMKTERFLQDQAPTSNVRECMEDSLPLLPLPSTEPSPSSSSRRKVNKKPTRFREAADHLVKLPKEGRRYLSKDGRPLWDDRYAYPRPTPRRTRRNKSPRARSKSPSPVPEAIEQSEPAEPTPPAKKRRIKLIVKKRPKAFEQSEPAPPIKKRRIKVIVKKRPKAIEESEQSEPAKKRRIKLIVKKRPGAFEESGESEPAPPAKKRQIKLIVKKRPLIKLIVKKPLVEINENKPPIKIKLKLNPTR